MNLVRVSGESGDVMTLRILPGSTGRGIRTAIQNRMGVSSLERIILTDDDGYDLVIDDSLQPGTYKLSTRAPESTGVNRELRQRVATLGERKAE